MEAQFLAVKENLAMVREDLRGKLAESEAGVAALEDDRVRLIRVVMSLPGGEGKLLPGDVEALERGGALPRGEEEEEMRVEAIVERLAKSQKELEEAQARLSVAVKDRSSLSFVPSNEQQQWVGGVTDQEIDGGQRGRSAVEDLEAEVERLRGGGGGWADRVAGLERCFLHSTTAWSPTRDAVYCPVPSQHAMLCDGSLNESPACCFDEPHHFL